MQLLTRWIKARTCSLYWGRRRNGNFGDDLSQPVCSHILGRRISYGSKSLADLWAIGSLLNYYSKERKRLKTTTYRRVFRRPPTVIWGTGSIDDSRLHLPEAKILALRGPLTAMLFDFKQDVPFGDPGLFVSEMVDLQERDERIGIVPHYVDKQSPVIAALLDDERFNVIDVESDWQVVAKEIGKSRAVLSSSLHGLIAADAFHVPRLWIELSYRVIGNGFKFTDYAAGIGRKKIGSMRVNTISDIENAICQVEDIGPSISRQKLRTIRNELRSSLCHHDFDS